MKIAFYCTSLTRSAGGVFYAAAGLASALVEAGHEVVVAGGADAHLDEDRHLWKGVELITYPLKTGTYGLDPRFVPAIWKTKPDLLHLHGIWSAGSAYARLLAMTGLPIVSSPHGMLDAWILSRSPRVKAVHAALFERPIFRHGHLHALNKPEYDSIVQYMPALADKCFIESNGIPDTEVDIPFSSKSGVLYLGRLHAKKQLLEFLEQWKQRGPRGERLTIAGWGDADYEAQVRSACDGIDGAEFIGAVYGDRKAALFASSQWFVLPSLSEGLPMAALEALQHGCVPVLTRECNLTELFDRDVSIEMQSDFSDFGSLATTISGMAAAQKEALSRQCVKVASDYSWRRIAQRMIGHYERVIR